MRRVETCEALGAVEALKDRMAETVSRMADIKADLSCMASACLRWDAQSHRFVSIDPWDALTTGNFRRARYESLRKNRYRSVVEQLEYDLLVLVYEGDEW